MDEITKAIYDRGNGDSVEKYDYFICSVAGALFAYVGQTYQPHKFDSLYSIMPPLALLFLVLSFMFGARRIYVANIAKKLNKEFVKEHLDCKHLTSQTDEYNKSKTPVRPEHSASGEKVTIDYLIKRRDGKLKFKEEIEKEARLRFASANKFQHWRDISLVCGFSVLLLSKLLQPYFT